MSRAYEPVYGDGTGLKGFVCLVPTGLKQMPTCGKLCHNQVGMLLHLERKHGVKLQQCLFEEASDEKT